MEKTQIGVADYTWPYCNRHSTNGLIALRPYLIARRIEGVLMCSNQPIKIEISVYTHTLKGENEHRLVVVI